MYDLSFYAALFAVSIVAIGIVAVFFKSKLSLTRNSPKESLLPEHWYTYLALAILLLVVLSLILLIGSLITLAL